MNGLHLAAALFFLLGLAHSVLGERFILIRLFQREDIPKLFGGPDFTRRTLRFAWHITTVAWWGLAALLWQASAGELTQKSTLTVIGLTAVLSGLLPLVITRGLHLSWIVLFLIGGLSLWHASAV